MAVIDVYFNVLMNFDEGMNIQIRHFSIYFFQNYLSFMCMPIQLYTTIYLSIMT